MPIPSTSALKSKKMREGSRWVWTAHQARLHSIRTRGRTHRASPRRAMIIDGSKTRATCRECARTWRTGGRSEDRTSNTQSARTVEHSRRNSYLRLLSNVQGNSRGMLQMGCWRRRLANGRRRKAASILCSLSLGFFISRSSSPRGPAEAVLAIRPRL